MIKKTYLGRLTPYLFLIPILSLLVIFKYIPFGMAMIESLYNWNGSTVNQFVGLDNFKEAFGDTLFWESIARSFIVLVVHVIIVIAIPLLTAELLFAVKKVKVQYITRTVFTATMVIPGMVVTLLWKWLLGGDTGVINLLLKKVGLENLATPWLADSGTALGAILAIGFPWIATLGGMALLVYFGGLQSIPNDYFETARLDGATFFQRFRYIDLPMLLSPIKLMVTLNMIQSLQIFGSIYVTTKGGPGNSTMVPAVYMYEQGFTYRRMGYCSALGLILFAVIMLITLFNNKFLKNTERE